TYAFFVLYANIDGFDAKNYTLEYEKLSVMDKWLLSKLSSMVKAVDENLANYRIPETSRVLDDFVDELPNWYVRRCRDRYWGPDMTQDKVNAYMTLYTALVTVAKAAAPMVPFLSEDIYQNLVRTSDKNAPESVHLCDFPTVNEAWIDRELEEDMEEVLAVVSLGRAARNNATIKTRQPIARMFIGAEKGLADYFTAIIADELNVKDVSFVTDASKFITYTFKPQLRTCGPKFGKYLGAIRTALSGLDGTAAMAELKETGTLKIDVGDTILSLAEEDLIIETAQTSGYESLSDFGVTVVLDTTLTPELIEEGNLREIISKIQTMRKDSGFEVTDHIRVYCRGNEKMESLCARHEDDIRAGVLGEAVLTGKETALEKEWNINGETVTLGVEKV
ncbi:MAG: class I tRNA ligase family protein, partial [Ruminococcus sp.]|nr:class I tRNA ligase family protein [Candidatus Apopatosoma intestinale]